LFLPCSIWLGSPPCPAISLFTVYMFKRICAGWRGILR
jgi:hypothetical protein